MENTYVKLMKLLYMLCVIIAGVTIAAMSIIVTWGVFTRYVLGSGSFWPEPVSIFLAIQATFYGAAACYRADVHIRLGMFVERLPVALQPIQRSLVHLLMAGISVFMIVFGARLVQTTFFQSYPEFQYIRVGVAYSAIPIAGLITLLFVLEKVFFLKAKSQGAS